MTKRMNRRKQARSEESRTKMLIVCFAGLASTMIAWVMFIIK